MARINPTDRIKVLIDHNPKLEGSKAFARFELYKNSETVAEFISIGGKRIDIINDIGQGYIALENRP